MTRIKNIFDMLSLASEIELTISEYYKKLAEKVSIQEISSELHRISREEFNHHLAIETGKKYADSSPELFAEEMISLEELFVGKEIAHRALAEINNEGQNLIRMLENIKTVEEKMEKIHLNTMYKFRDNRLRKLFEAIFNDDHAHVEKLSSLIYELEPFKSN